MSDIPTSGAISLNQMHTEVDGTSGSTVSINDADIRGLIGKSSGATMSFNEWYGASSAVDTQTVTVGNTNLNIYGTVYNTYGFSTGIGTISDGTCNFKSGASIYQVNYFDINGNSNQAIYFSLTGNHANSGFTTMSIAGTNYTRTDASYSYTSGTNRSLWVWTATSNPFGTTVGATKTVVWT